VSTNSILGDQVKHNLWQIKDADQKKFISLAKKLHNPLAKNTSLSNAIYLYSIILVGEKLNHPRKHNEK